jgi:hypothetical protein
MDGFTTPDGPFHSSVLHTRLVTTRRYRGILKDLAFMRQQDLANVRNPRNGAVDHLSSLERGFSGVREGRGNTEIG